MSETKTTPESFENLLAQIERDVKTHKVILYAKGEKNAAMCGFSHKAMEVLNACGCPYEVRNVLAVPGLREALVRFSRWPTTPQLFVNGKLVGGCDIMVEMFERGELQKIIREALAS